MKLVTEGNASFARGMDTSPVPLEVQGDEVAMMVNCRVSNQGGAIEPRRGLTMTSTPTSGNGIQALRELKTAAGVHQLVRVENGTGQIQFSTDYGLTWDLLSQGAETEGLFTRGLGRSGLSMKTRGLFARGLGIGGAESVISAGASGQYMTTMREGGTNIMVISDPSASVGYRWNGAGFSTISGFPAGGVYLAVHGERLIVAGHSGVEVAASKVGDVNTWAAPDGWVVQAATADGDLEIMGLLSLGTILLVFKRHSVGYIEGYGYQTLQVSAGARGLSQSVGCVAPRSIQACGSYGCIWYSERGFEYFDLRTREVTLISRPTQAVIDTLRYDLIDTGTGQGSAAEARFRPDSLYWPEKNEYWCMLPHEVDADSKAGCQWVYVYRLPEGGRPAAQWLFHYEGVVAGKQSVIVDTDGYLKLISAGGISDYDDEDAVPDGTHHMWWVVDRGGYGYPAELPVLGGVVGADAEKFGAIAPLNTNIESLYCLAISDTPTKASQPWVGFRTGTQAVAESYKGPGESVLALTTGAVRAPAPMTWRVRSRKFVYGDQRARKRAKRVRFTVKVDDDVSAKFHIYLIIDGVRQTRHTVTVAANTAPKEVTVRVGGRGRAFQVELVSRSMNVLLTSMYLDSQFMPSDKR